MTSYKGTLLLAVIVAVSLTACARGANTLPPPMDALLWVTGFRLMYPDTPAKSAHLAALTQRKLVLHELDGEPVYVYADATACECLYVGTQAAYRRFQRLAWYRRVERTRRVASRDNPGAPMDWSLWRSWEPAC